MSDVKWIKLSVNMFDDEKIKLIEAMPEKDTIYYIWIRLLQLAGKTNDNGQIYITESMPYTDEMLSTLFNRPINSIRLAIKTFSDFGMVTFLGNGRLHLTNWDKHQNVKGLDDLREKNRERVAKYRQKLKLLDSECNVTSNDTVSLLSISNSYSNSKSCIKHKYMDDVSLTSSEFFKLREKFGKQGTREWCEKLSLWKGSNGKKKKNDYKTILVWAKNDNKQYSKQNTQPIQTSRALTPAEITKKYEEEYGIKGER